jgi:peptidoglycan/xylan/chitin deacetylase (PgdA/CDA1 family)
MIPVLYYHRVGRFAPGEARKMNVEPERFRAQMKLLREKHRPVSLDEVVAGAPAGSVAVTFDDGYRDLMEHALPVLREFRIPATFFVVVEAVGGKDGWYRGDRDIVTWEDLRALVAAGLGVGSHSLTHARLDRCDEATARRELVESKRVLEEKLSMRVDHFAWPQGESTEVARQAAAEAGYRAAWATKKGEGGPFAWKRLPVASEESAFRFSWKLRKARLGWY